MIEAIAEGFRADGLQDKLTALETRKREIEESLKGAAPSPPLLHPNLSELYRRKVEGLHEVLTDPAIRQEAIDLLRGLIESISITPSEDGYEIELIGNIVNMIELPGDNVPDPFRRSVKVVAGAGSQRYLHLDYAPV